MSRVAFHRAFEELNDDEITYIRANAKTISFEDGAIILKEAEASGQVLVLMEGRIRVVRLLQGGFEKDLTDPLLAGDTVGEMSFIDGIGASATLIAVGDVVVRAIDHDLVKKMELTNSGFLQRFYHSLLLTVIRRLRLLDQKIAYPS